MNGDRVTKAVRQNGISLWLAVRSVMWIVLLPGVVAGYVPWRFLGVGRVAVKPRDPVQLLGVALMLLGALLLLTCIWEFALFGRGTLSPLDPPTTLVVRGLYRFVRNPMYVSVTVLLIGEVLLSRSTALLVYGVVWFGWVNVFVIGYEEPALRRTFGASYEQYAASVGRWLPW